MKTVYYNNSSKGLKRVFIDFAFCYPVSDKSYTCKRLVEIGSVNKTHSPEL